MRLLILSLLLSTNLFAKSNILVITIDDFKPNLGSYGDHKAISPAIDALASRGTLFTSAYCQQSVCAPSRVSMFTGLRPDTTGVLDLHTYMRAINPDVVTLPQFFRENGYTTIGYGKLMHGAKNDDKDKSWSEFADSLPFNSDHPAPILDKFQDPKCHEIYKKLSKNGKKVKTPLLVNKLKALKAYPVSEAFDLPDDTYRDGAIAKLGIKRLKELKGSGENFALFLGFTKPHLPFNAPKKYWDLYDPENFELAAYRKQDKQRPNYAYHSYGELAAYSGYEIGKPVAEDKQRHLIHAYYACVSYVDAQVGKVLDELKKLDMEKDTIVVLWGDHGWHLGDHGIWCKHSNFEQATRAPLIISAPGMTAGQVSESSAEFIDIFPTLCDLSELQGPKALEGESLVPVLKDANATVKPYAVSQYKRWASHGYTMRKGRYRLTLWMPKNYFGFQKFDESQIKEMELYDYQKDPNETTNFAKHPEYANVVKDMKKSFAEFFASQYDEEKASRIPSLVKKHSRK